MPPRQDERRASATYVVPARADLAWPGTTVADRTSLEGVDDSRIDANEGGAGRQDFGLFDFQPVLVQKAANSLGLQLADLTARSIAGSGLSPGQPNHAFEIVWPKIGGLARLP